MREWLPTIGSICFIVGWSVCIWLEGKKRIHSGRLWMAARGLTVVGLIVQIIPLVKKSWA
jgi:hypothetical protein